MPANNQGKVYVADDGSRYEYNASVVETYYGPEQRVKFWPEGEPEMVYTNQEAATVEQCIQWRIDLYK